MFVLTTVADSVRIPPAMFSEATQVNVHNEIDKKYPNRVIMDVGLVICRYGNALKIGDGMIVPGDGAAHHEVVFRLVVFRPFVDEVCVGSITGSDEEGITVSLGFFGDIFIPSYWMLRPSHYEKQSGLWVWTPDYGDEKEDVDSISETITENCNSNGNDDAVVADLDVNTGDAEITNVIAVTDSPKADESENRFEMEIGSEIRFKVKAINFTQVTKTAKGVQARTTTTASDKSSGAMERSLSGGGTATETAGSGDGNTPVRRRSSSADLSDTANMPSAMHIVASICEDGLGLTCWWAATEEEEGEEVEEELVQEIVEDEYCSNDLQ